MFSDRIGKLAKRVAGAAGAAASTFRKLTSATAHQTKCAAGAVKRTVKTTIKIVVEPAGATLLSIGLAAWDAAKQLPKRRWWPAWAPKFEGVPKIPYRPFIWVGSAVNTITSWLRSWACKPAKEASPVWEDEEANYPCYDL